MKREFSVYLDAVRFSAALTVFAAHLTFAEFSGGVTPYQGKLASAAVTAFFVLSGYVIAYVSHEKEKTLRAFAISRLARVYSVALLAIVVAIGVDLLAMRYGWPRNVPLYQYRSFPKYLALAVTFTGQAGLLSESTFGAHTFWSLDYEVWYYAIFACAMYFFGAARFILIVMLLILSGPRIAIDFPMWLAGVGVYKLHQSKTVSHNWALTGFYLSLLLLVAIRATATDLWVDNQVNVALHGWPVHFLSNSQEFASEYIVALLIAINLFSARYLPLTVLRNEKLARVITYVASFTFTLYLMQRSLLDLFSYSLEHNPHSLLSFIGLVVLTVFSVWA